MVLSKTNVEAIWLKKLLHLKFFSNYTHNCFSNNQSASALNINPKYHSCNKHVGTWYHFIKD